MTSLKLDKKRQEAEKYYAAENSLKETVLFESILNYYEQRGEWLEEVQDICGDSKRLKRLDLIVTRQALGQVSYFLGQDKKIPFNMVASYEQQLRHYQKRYFDCFRRRSKLELDGGFETSYCQLNFFRWMHQFSILKHLHLGNHINMPSKSKSKSTRDQLVLFRGSLTLPSIPGPPPDRFKLLLTAQKEYSLLNRSIYYYRIQPLQGLGTRRGWTKLLPK